LCYKNQKTTIGLGYIAFSPLPPLPALFFYAHKRGFILAELRENGNKKPLLFGGKRREDAGVLRKIDFHYHYI